MVYDLGFWERPLNSGRHICTYIRISLRSYRLLPYSTPVQDYIRGHELSHCHRIWKGRKTKQEIIQMQFFSWQQIISPTVGICQLFPTKIYQPPHAVFNSNFLHDKAKHSSFKKNNMPHKGNVSTMKTNYWMTSYSYQYHTSSPFAIFWVTYQHK